MKFLGRIAVAVLVGAVAAGCTRVSETQFNNEKVAIQGSPALKQAVLRDCNTQLNAKPQQTKKAIAMVMNVSPSRVVPLFCRRMVDAIVSDRLTYSDYRRVFKGLRVDQTNIIKIIQGR